MQARRRICHTLPRTLLYAAAAAVLAAAARADVVPINGPLAFNLSNTATAGGDKSSGLYIPIDIYSEPTGFGVVVALPPVPSLLPRGGGPNDGLFLSTLKSAFSTGWNFPSANADLNPNTLQVNAYQVAGGSHNPCFKNAAFDCVGIYGPPSPSPVGFAVSYTGPAVADDAHWIQVLATNSPAAGRTSPYVDNNGSTTNPYYDLVKGATADATTFLDSPQRAAAQSQYWIADLYYASGPDKAGKKDDPAQVTLYNGLMYGWADLFVNTSNFGAFLSAVNTDFTSVANLDSALGADLTGVVTPGELAQIDSEFIAAVPEPAAWLPVAGLVGWLIYRRRKAGARGNCARE